MTQFLPSAFSKTVLWIWDWNSFIFDSSQISLVCTNTCFGRLPLPSGAIKYLLFCDFHRFLAIGTATILIILVTRLLRGYTSRSHGDSTQTSIDKEPVTIHLFGGFTISESEGQPNETCNFLIHYTLISGAICVSSCLMEKYSPLTWLAFIAWSSASASSCETPS